ncbi:MAG: YceD family protein [Gallionellaceae bacterium]|jgi:uncharacterized protein|nr:YceD family protein [Gallionellaceae bacterium]
MFARPFIDNLDFARNGKELRGEIAVADMPRLQDMLAAPDGVVHYVVRGLLGKDGNPMLELELDGRCYLRCQRCLEAMDYPVKQKSRLLLAPESELDAFADDENELDSIATDRHFDVLDLVEQEILLNLPFAPRHPEGGCKAMDMATQPDKNPFAVLASLKKGKGGL